MLSDVFACNKLNYKKFANVLLPNKIFVDLRLHLSYIGTYRASLLQGLVNNSTKMGILISSFIKWLWQIIKTKQAACTQIVITGATHSVGEDMYSIRMMKDRNLLVCLMLIKNYAEKKAFNLNVRNTAFVFKVQYFVEKACHQHSGQPRIVLS